MKRHVILDHDGGIDDYLSVLLMLTFADVELLGVTVTPADCYIQPAVSTTRKILDFMNAAHIPVSAGTLRGQNAFPRIWRRESFFGDALPILNENGPPQTPLHPLPGHEHLVEMLREAQRPVHMVATGPLTQLAWALDHAPDIEGKIARLYWMGGALRTAGNVREDPGVHDGSAEWNVYWDPPAAARVWQSAIPIALFPLDVSERAAVTTEFRRRLARQRRYPVSDLAGQLWAGVAHNPHYRFWDVLTTAAFANPALVAIRPERCRVVVDGPSAGRIELCDNGRPVDAAYEVNLPALHDFLLAQFRR